MLMNLKLIRRSCLTLFALLLNWEDEIEVKWIVQGSSILGTELIYFIQHNRCHTNWEFLSILKLKLKFSARFLCYNNNFFFLFLISSFKILKKLFAFIVVLQELQQQQQRHSLGWSYDQRIRCSRQSFNSNHPSDRESTFLHFLENSSTEFRVWLFATHWSYSCAKKFHPA